MCTPSCKLFYYFIWMFSISQTTVAFTVATHFGSYLWEYEMMWYHVIKSIFWHDALCFVIRVCLIRTDRYFKYLILNNVVCTNAIIKQKNVQMDFWCNHLLDWIRLPRYGRLTDSGCIVGWVGLLVISLSLWGKQNIYHYTVNSSASHAC